MLTVNSFQSNRGWFVNNLFHLLGILCARSNAKNFPFIFLLNSFCHPVSFAFWGNWSLERWKSLCTAQLQGLRLPHNVSNLKAITFNHCSILPRKTQTVFWWMKGWRKVNQGDRKQASREQPHEASVKCLLPSPTRMGFPCWEQQYSYWINAFYMKMPWAVLNQGCKILPHEVDLMW